ncbi:hypothetical protein Q3G72_014874 [Acer saccharum]|nr:hypothetical protein Q3G72_014874 [Acer saccharum]
MRVSKLLYCLQSLTQELRFPEMESHLCPSILPLHTQNLNQKTQTELSFVNSFMGNANQLLSSKMAMPSSSSSHHDRFLSSSSFFSTRVGAGQSNISISGVQLGKSNNYRRKCATFKRHVTTSILADVAKDFMVVEQGHYLFPLPEEELSQLFDIAEDRISIFGTGPGMDGSNENSIVKWYGLINEIVSKGKHMTYEELCNAVLANQHERVRLVDRGPKVVYQGSRYTSELLSAII